MISNEKDLIRGELIGKKATITIHNNEFEGQIIDETKNTITILTKTGRNTIIKNQATIKINNLLIDGKKLAKRPEERIKIK